MLRGNRKSLLRADLAEIISEILDFFLFLKPIFVLTFLVWRHKTDCIVACCITAAVPLLRLTDVFCLPERLIFEIKKKTRNIEGKPSTAVLYILLKPPVRKNEHKGLNWSSKIRYF